MGCSFPSNKPGSPPHIGGYITKSVVHEKCHHGYLLRFGASPPFHARVPERFESGTAPDRHTKGVDGKWLGGISSPAESRSDEAYITLEWAHFDLASSGAKPQPKIRFGAFSFLQIWLVMRVARKVMRHFTLNLLKSVPTKKWYGFGPVCSVSFSAGASMQ